MLMVKAFLFGLRSSVRVLTPLTTEMLIQGGAKAIIHVHQQKIKKGEPSIIVRRRGKSQHFTHIEILGSSVMVHSKTPDSCGARVWIESHADIRAYSGDAPR